MSLTPAERSRRYRDRIRGGAPRAPKPHGSNAAIRRHERAGEPLCSACEVERARLNRLKYEAALAARDDD